MTLLEILIFIILFLGLLSLGIRRLRTSRLLPVLAGTGALLVVVAVITQFRWQLIPALVIALLLVLFTVVTSRPGQLNPVRTSLVILAMIPMVVVLLLTPVFGTVFPVFALPEPSGPYPVGMSTRHLIDSDRDETYTEDPDDARELMITFWYPASRQARGAYAPYPAQMGEVTSISFNLPSFLFSHFDRVSTHSIPDAPIAEGEDKYPVILFSHGIMASRYQSVYQMEELASRGYVVIGIQHPYDAVVTRFPDGRVARTEVLPVATAGPERNVEQVAVRVADTRFVLDYLEDIVIADPEDPFTDRIDLSRIGMLGHSYGAATTVQALGEDSRVVAGVSLDGPVFGSVRETGVDQPLLFMHTDTSFTYEPTEAELATMGLSSEEYAEVMADYRAGVTQVYENVRNDVYWLILNGASHFHFADGTLYSPILAGRLSVPRAHQIVNAYTLAFFDQYLKDVPSQLLQGSSADYPEIMFDSRRFDGA